MKLTNSNNKRFVIRTKFCKFLLIFLIGLNCQSAISKAIFYQPLSRDSVISNEQWNDLFDQVYKEGYRELVVQWTHYGSVNLASKGSFLRKVIRIAESKDLKIWLGLYMPDDYYQVMESKKTTSTQYFKSALSKNRRLLSVLEIQSLVNDDMFAGWYLPMELTRKYVIQGSTHEQELIFSALKEFISSVDEKIAISYFLSEHTSFKSAFFDITLLNTMGFNLWLQKGNGLKKDTVARQLIERMECEIGVISENFIQISENNLPFKARKGDEIKTLGKRANCHKHLTFSLRYLPYSPLQLNQ